MHRPAVSNVPGPHGNTTPVTPYQIPGQRIFFVDCENGSDATDIHCTSWSSACRDPQYALDLAANQAANLGQPTQVWMKAGVCPRFGKGPLELRSHVEVYGGFQGTENSPDDRPVAGATAWDLDPQNAASLLTVLEGQDATHLGEPCTASTCEPQLVHAQSIEGAVLDGVAIQHGYAETVPGPFHVERSEVQFRHVLLSKNTVTGRIGSSLSVAYVERGFQAIGAPDEYRFPSFVDCRFEGNVAEIWSDNPGTVYVFNSFVVFRGCLFRDNLLTGSGSGAGLSIVLSRYAARDATDQALILDTSFESNDASGTRVGGLYAGLTGQTLRVQGCVFRDNTATSGGGARLNLSSGAEVHVLDTQFVSNVARSGGWSENGGGALVYFNSADATAVFHRVVFSENEADPMGGAIFVQDGNEGLGTVVVRDSLFSRNRASTSRSNTTGGAIAISTSHARGGVLLVNNTFTQNTVSCQGTGCNLGAGGIHVYGENTGDLVRIWNAILWGNETGGVSNSVRAQLGCGREASMTTCTLGDYFSVSWSDVEGGDATSLGTGNIALDPLFADPASGNYRLRRDSPCVDSGWTGTVDGTHTPTVDLDGYSRPVDVPSVADSGSGDVPYMDMGAYEVQTLPLGSECQDATATYCEFGFCVNGVCCNEACDGQCDDVCDETGHCLYKQAGTACDDGQYCTVGDACDGQGQCTSGPPRDCTPESPLACTEYLCDEHQDTCVARPASSDTPCDDGDPCTGPDHCDGQGMGRDACTAGTDISAECQVAECVVSAECVQENPSATPTCNFVYDPPGTVCGERPVCVDYSRCSEEHECIPGEPFPAGDDPHEDCPGGQVCDGQGGCMAVLHVKVDGDDGNDGLTWATALATPQGAVARCRALGLSPCEVWVAEGEYLAPGWRSPTVRLEDQVHFYGGFSGTEVSRSKRNWSAHRSVLVGGTRLWWLPGGGLLPVSRVVVVDGAEDVVLDGFEVRGVSGGSIWANRTGLLVTGGSRAVQIRNVWVYGVLGTGVVVRDSDADVENALVYGNYFGEGGVKVSGAGSRQVRLRHVTVTENLGMLWDGVVVSGQVEPELVNSIVWGNDALLDGTWWWWLVGCPGWARASHSDIEDTRCVHMGPGSISQDPEFVSGSVGELSGESPCIDAADDNQASALDLGHRGRVDVPGVGSSVADMGAYEYQPGAGGPVAAR